MVQRFWELDAARGVAALMMIAFHALFDLWYFRGLSVVLDSGFWLVFARVTLVTFLMLVGISLSLSYSRVKDRLSPYETRKKYLKRGLRIFGCGLAITVVTLVAFPSSAIWFGVLHLIGLSIILSIPFLSRQRSALVLGLVFILSGLLLSQMTFSFPWLMPLGFLPAGLYTFDYVPLLPWFGVVLLGLFFGSTAYRNRKPKSGPAAAKPLCLIGRHSLFIYLVHQPVLVAMLLLIS